eukprot:479843_1
MDKPTWSCNSCTLDNKLTSQSCEMCGTKNTITSKPKNSNLEAEDEKDEKIIYEALERIRERGIMNTKKLTWKLVHMENKNEYKYDEKDENNANKNKKEKEEERLSQLIDESKKEMCKYGHGIFACAYDGTYNYKCISCGSNKQIKYCKDCYFFAYDKGMQPKEFDYCYCFDCRIANSKNIKNRIEMNKFKADIIREELLKNPCLEMDLLCGMKRRAAVDLLIDDVNKLERDKRLQWC